MVSTNLPELQRLIHYATVRPLAGPFYSLKFVFKIVRNDFDEWVLFLQLFLFPGSHVTWSLD